MAQRRSSISMEPRSKFGAVVAARRMSRALGKPEIQLPEKAPAPEVASEEPKFVAPEEPPEPVLEKDNTALIKYSRYLIQLPSEKCTVAFYHHVPNITSREVIEGIQAALTAAYRPPDSIVSVELVPLISRAPEYYTENRWVVEMVDEELASLLFRSDVYVRARKVTVTSLAQALNNERSREFRDQLRLRMQKVGGQKPPPVTHGGPNMGRRMSRAVRMLDVIEDPKTAVQQQFQ